MPVMVVIMIMKNMMIIMMKTMIMMIMTMMSHDWPNQPKAGLGLLVMMTSVASCRCYKGGGWDGVCLGGWVAGCSTGPRI